VHISIKMVLQHRVLSRRKNELTFKGDFWVNDTTFAIKKLVWRLQMPILIAG
jgi:hypothetical protein